MKRMLKLTMLILSGVLSYCGGIVANAEQQLIPEGSLASVESKKWIDKTNVSVIDLDPSLHGVTGKAFRFYYKGDKNSSADATSELRFDLGAEYTDITIEFDLWIPENYYHRKPTDKIHNNKFFRVWRKNYSEGDHVGSSLMNQGDERFGDSMLTIDYKVHKEWAISTAVHSQKDFITGQDRKKWMAIKIELEAPKASDDLGAIRIYKNGSLFLGTHSVTDVEPGLQGWRYGYLLGWSNSGFEEDTILLIKNATIKTDAINRPNKPISPVIYE